MNLVYWFQGARSHDLLLQHVTYLAKVAHLISRLHLKSTDWFCSILADSSSPHILLIHRQGGAGSIFDLTGTS